MASTEFRIIKQADEDLIESIRKISDECQLPSESNISVRLFREQPPISANIGNVRTSLQYILSLNSTLIHQLTLQFQSRVRGGSLTIDSGPSYDNVTVSYGNDADINIIALIIASSKRNLKAIDRKEHIEELLGEELSEYYRHRETALNRLEFLSEKLITANEQYRRTLDEELSENRKKLDREYLDEKQISYAILAEKEDALKKREEELEKKTKEIDDRDNIHARRQIRIDLKDELAQRSLTFNLTKSTSMKRLPIHAIFILLIIAAGLLFGKAFYDQIGSTMDNWIIPLKLGLSTAAFAAALIFYIRWNDQWFRQHADEEFKLKRLELDVDRASWVVEMAHEWKESEIPEVLLQNLSKNLFSTEKEEKSITHPSEDLASALLGACTGVTVRIPNFGEMVLNRKDLKKFQKTLEEPKI